MNHEQSTSSIVTTRTETTHGPTYSMVRAIRSTAWKKVRLPMILLLMH